MNNKLIVAAGVLVATVYVLNEASRYWRGDDNLSPKDHEQIVAQVRKAVGLYPTVVVWGRQLGTDASPSRVCGLVRSALFIDPPGSDPLIPNARMFTADYEDYTVRNLTIGDRDAPNKGVATECAIIRGMPVD